jgi:hypothetical protein
MDREGTPALFRGDRDLGTSCPRLTIWEDAVDGGYVARESVAGFGVIITVTEDGEKLLHNNGRVG